ncbi:MAG: beta-ketoacyl-[acyl-carrier-protein] synthase family protein [Myxococcales bacterium]|nr:beta-ketoacyl-[acyl-carrier-protein] synthase family protein [Myxococcales bacterium]
MIAVTGVGAVSALGGTAPSTFEAVCAGRSAIASCGTWAGAPAVATIAGGPHLGSDLAEQAVREALAQAGCDATDLGLVGASTAGDMTLGEPSHFALLRDGTVQPDFLWTQLPDSPTLAVARRLGINGPRLTVSTACTSGAAAVGVAADWVRRGRCQRAVAFGVDALCGTTVYGFRSLGLISPDRCRPFDAARSGMSVGEGAGALVLESGASARARGAEVIAWLSGYGSASDAHHMAAPHPDGRGARAALDQALAQAGDARDVGYVNAHGTATELNDATEVAVFADRFADVPLSGVKGALGHTLGGAGALEAVITALSLQRCVLPPNVGVREALPGIELLREPTEARVARAVSVNLAFGGASTALVLEASWVA